MKGQDGVVVVDVQPESAASDAGLKVGDILKQVDGKDVAGPQTVRDAIQGHQPGSTISIVVERAGAAEDALRRRSAQRAR